MPVIDKRSLLFKKFCQAMEDLGPFEDSPSLSVGVSGGSDSLALVFLLHQWLQIFKGSLHAFHVDHKLRPTSTEEAHQVKSWLEISGITCHILTWAHEFHPVTGLQEKARKARYALLDKACLDHGILHLAIAHHQEDQQETHRFRHQAQSTEYGLAGMSAATYLPNCRLIRPLLTFRKDELKESLGAHPSLEDPSNKDLRFQRAQLRQQPCPSIDVSSYQKNRRHEEEEASGFLATHVEIAKEGYGSLPIHALELTPPKTIKRALSFLIRCIGNLDYLPSPLSIDQIYKKLRSSNYSTTSLGCCVVYIRQKKIWVVPDSRSLPPTESLQDHEKLWNRFILQGRLPLGITIKPLGSKGWDQIKSLVITSLPYHVVVTFPAYWHKRAVVAVPFLNFQKNTTEYPSFLYQPKNSLLAELFV